MANNALFSAGNAGNDMKIAFTNRILDSLLRVKQELGIDELLLSIHDAKKLASDKVRDYLAEYSSKVAAAVAAADTAAKLVADKLLTTEGGIQRTGKMTEKLIGMAWKNSYEASMEDINSLYPLAQQIVSKYMSNFSVRPKMT
jgi:hypothetical protein